MFTIAEITVLMSFSTMMLSLILSTYLITLWRAQENRLYTDIPLMLGVIFLVTVLSQSMMVLDLLGFIEMTINVFRIRAGIVLGMALPMLGVMLTIWAPRRAKHHGKIGVAFSVYWIGSVLLGRTSEEIMMLVIPPLLVLMISWLVTFTITWITGRLKEIRSDLMVIATILSIVSQTGRLAFTSFGIGYMSDILTAISLVFYTLALTNPWFKKEKEVRDPDLLATRMVT
ncbi:MAG: hypothetical protein ACFFD6_09025 [Candidatus Thorarchaeota archaeon]